LALVDNKGRLFGKVSIIDVAIILIIVAVVTGSLYKLKLFDRHTSDEQLVAVTILLREVSLETVEALRVGDQLTESTENLPLGIIVKKEVRKALKDAPTADGRLVAAESPNKFDVVLTTEGNLRVTGDQVFVGRRDIKIGLSMNIKSPRSVCFPVVTDFQVKN
jgi:hypothetical protein